MRNKRNKQRALLPKTIVISLRSPARLGFFASAVDFSGSPRINGEEMELSDAPWTSTVADILVDEETSVLAGLSFICCDEKFWRDIQDFSAQFDPRAVRLSDRFFDGNEHRFEVMWANSGRLRFESAHLLCGQWAWCYSRSDGAGELERAIAVVITDVDDVLKDHDLNLPSVFELGDLDVRF